MRTARRIVNGRWLILIALVIVPACRERPEGSWDWNRMRSQPRYQPYGNSNGHSMMRPPPYGAISRESLAEEESSTRPVADSARGRSQYEIFCASCHGARGDGKSAVGASTPELSGLSLLSSSARSMDDAQLFVLLRDGTGRMPAFASQLSATDRWMVMGYVKRLQQNEVE